MRVLSGIQPSGRLHLGNYFGMMRPMLEYQKTSELFCFIVNYHALTTQPAGAALRDQTVEAACDFLALGLEPERCVFWIQSDLSEVTELAWILSNVTGMGLLERCHSYKDKITQGIKPSHGLFAYPVLMAADILIMQAARVPVGSDQKQHVEVARDIAGRFNRVYGETFTLPEPEIRHGGELLPGTDGRKMSKAYKNVIEIFSTKDELKKNVARIKTDSSAAAAAKKASGNDLFRIYAAFLDEAGRSELEERFRTPGLRYSDIKNELTDVIWKYFEPYREKRARLAADRDGVIDVLRRGAEKARRTARPTLERVRAAVGVAYDV